MCNKFKLGLVCGMLVISVFSSAQTPDVFRVEYMAMPKNKTDIETDRIKLVLNIPIPIREKKDYLVIGGEYNKLGFTVPSTLLPQANDIKALHILDLNLAYVYKLTEEWRLIGVLTPRWASNFVVEVQREDFNVNLTAGAYKSVKAIEKPFKLVLGLAYNSSSPIQVPLPVVYYEKQFHPRWAYIVGVPKSGIKYYTKKGHFFQSELFLDGYYVNIQNNILLSNTNLSTDVSSSALLLTLGYQYKFTKDISFYLIAGHSLVQNGVLRDNDRNNIFTLNDSPGLYFRTGFRIGI